MYYCTSYSVGDHLGSIGLFDVKCKGHESVLNSCEFNTNGNCPPGYSKAAVLCTPSCKSLNTIYKLNINSKLMGNFKLQCAF